MNECLQTSNIHRMTTESKIKKTQTEVLIIGAGPAGLMTACWLARTGVPFRIIDKRTTDIFAGQADGLQCRTLEIFQSLGFGDRAWKEANHMLEMAFWSPNEEGDLARNTIIADTIPGISRFQQCVLHQGHIEKWFYDSINKWSGGKSGVERPLLPLSINVDDSKVNDSEAYPVSVLVQNLTKENERKKQSIPEQFGSNVENGLYRQFDGDQEQFYANLKTDIESNDSVDKEEYEVIECKYVVGCDGAHSWVRKQMGINMEGETTDFVWGVLDMVPLTNFPDIRKRGAIHSKDSGSIMIIPRENDIVRLYIQLNEIERDPETKNASEFGGGIEDKTAKSKGRVDRSKITPEVILKTAQKSFSPFEFEITDLSWFTGYQIGQRVSPSFSKHSNRIFIAGDACHTHSPKAGQGMNVSMMDTFNLGWKLAYVIRGLASRDILSTYESERIKIARELINFDHKLSRMFSGKPMIPSKDALTKGEGVDMDEFHKAFYKGNEFASGTSVDYNSSALVVKPEMNEEADKYVVPEASNIPIGRRFDTTLVVTHSDARPIQIVDRMLSDGRWRILNFSGDVKKDSQMDALNKISDYIYAKDSFRNKYTPINAHEDSVFDVLTIYSSKRSSLELFDFPRICVPQDHKKRRNYWKLHCGIETTLHEGECNAYKKYGIDTEKGCVVVVRPDGYVSLVTDFSLDGYKKISDFFDGFMIPQTKTTLPPPSEDDIDRFVKPLFAI